MNETKLFGYADMSATVVSRHFCCTPKTIKRLRRRFPVTGNVADRPRSGRPRMTTAADNRYIVLQHLRNRRLTAAATGRQYGIHPQTVRNGLRKKFNLFMHTDRTSVKFSTTSPNGEAGLVPLSPARPTC